MTNSDCRLVDWQANKVNIVNDIYIYIYIYIYTSHISLTLISFTGTYEPTIDLLPMSVAS